MAVHGFTGYNALMKRSGTASGGLTIGDQRNILCVEVNPDAPDNNTYVNTINRGGYPSTVVAGRGSPIAEFHSMMKPYNSTTHVGWSDIKYYKSAMSLGSDSNTDVFDMMFYDEQLARNYNWGRCTMIEFACAAVGGPVSVRHRYPCRWGQDETTDPNACPFGTTLPSGEVIPAAPTFTVPSGPDPGASADVIMTQITGMSHVKSFNLIVIRPETNQYHFNGDRAPEDLASGQLSGLLTVEQEADATTVIDNRVQDGVSGTASITFCSDKSTANGKVVVSMLLVRDRRIRNPIPGIVSVVRTYSCMDLAAGGNPVLFS